MEERRMHMRQFTFGFLASLVVVLPAWGQGTKPRVEKPHLEAKLFAVDVDGGSLVVIEGDYTRPGQKGNKDKPAKPYIIKLDKKTTKIHHYDKNDKVSIEEMLKLSERRITIPMTIYYEGDKEKFAYGEQGENPASERSLKATEIIIRPSPDEKDKSKPYRQS